MRGDRGRKRDRMGPPDRRDIGAQASCILKLLSQRKGRILGTGQNKIKKTSSSRLVVVESHARLTSPGSDLAAAALDELVPDELDPAEDSSKDPAAEAADAVEGLSELVGVVVGAASRRQVGGPEAAEQQGQEQVQNLHGRKLVIQVRFIT